MMKSYADRKRKADISNQIRTMSHKPSNVKDIGAGKFTGDGPDMFRVNLKGAQNRSKRKPVTLPKII